MAERGLLTRDVDPADGRAVRVAPTDRGAELAGRAIVEVERADARFFGAEAAAVPLLRRLALLGEVSDPS